MLHSTLPRAFLPPGLSYLSGYYAEDTHLYPASSVTYVPSVEDQFSSRIPDHRLQLSNWSETTVRPMSPCPLDLSLKAPQNSNTLQHQRVEEIEVDDDVDRQCRISQRRYTSRIGIKRSYSNSDDLESSRPEDPKIEIRRSPSPVHSYHSYDELPKESSIRHLRLPPPDDLMRTSPVLDYSYDLVKNQISGPREMVRKSHHLLESSPGSCQSEQQESYLSSQQQKLLLGSPSHLHAQSYHHQQLLLTPQHHLQGIHAPMTPPSTPSPPQCHRRRIREESDVTPPGSTSTSSSVTPKTLAQLGDKLGQRPKKKHARRLKFDEDTSSPVSGTVILGPDEAVVTGDIDPAFNIVEVTEEARAELAKIENRLGPYQCKLCRHLHEDAFQLAQHRCSRIAHVEYRCPECDKRFSCPANLASHRRWHKPRIPNGENLAGTASTGNGVNAIAPRETEISCARCDAKFTRPAALRKHLAAQHMETNNNVNLNNNNNNSSNNNNADGFEEQIGTAAGKPIIVSGTINLGNASIANEIP